MERHLVASCFRLESISMVNMKVTITGCSICHGHTPLDMLHSSLGASAILNLLHSMPEFKPNSKNQIQVQLAYILFLLLLFGNNKNESEPLSIWFLDFGLENQ